MTTSTLKDSIGFWAIEKGLIHCRIHHRYQTILQDIHEKAPILMRIADLGKLEAKEIWKKE